MFVEFYIYIYIYIYEQYNPETARRNTPKLKHSISIEKNKTPTETELTTLIFIGKMFSFDLLTIFIFIISEKLNIEFFCELYHNLSIFKMVATLTVIMHRR